jgi:hypothetical protein
VYTRTDGWMYVLLQMYFLKMYTRKPEVRMVIGLIDVGGVSVITLLIRFSHALRRVLSFSLSLSLPLDPSPTFH